MSEAETKSRAPGDDTGSEHPAPPAAPPAATAAAVDNPLPADRYLNRELSWVDFNARVLALAADTSMPLLERAKFLAIFASNLDEFYMVRVAGLKRRDEMGLTVRSADGLTPREQSHVDDEGTSHDVRNLDPALWHFQERRQIGNESLLSRLREVGRGGVTKFEPCVVHNARGWRRRARRW